MTLEFREVVSENDYGLIISDNGNLRGIWVPEDKSGCELPHAVVKICMDFYGIDPRDDFENRTVH